MSKKRKWEEPIKKENSSTPIWDSFVHALWVIVHSFLP